ncbi:type II toxin-antitoxin system Phd/YefM family antitoxin [Sphingomonas sp. 1P08PE]|uniref:type II toxin-antitoxin system Phd/YefM family antitoxin n=1 Tax=Sphingomonas sp. 1P08PE TaxID=554122 RepID=UPI00399F694B
MTRHFTAREFNQDVARAKRATSEGPVIITDRGHPAHVLLSYDEYRRLSGDIGQIAGLFGSRDTVDIDFETDRRQPSSLKPLDVD